MTTQRRSYETGHKPKCLVIVDDTAEWDRAVYYASRWAIRVGGGVVMLRIIETEDQNQQWLGVADIMRAEAHEDANAALDRAAGRANGIAAITPERVIREGDPTEQILDVIDKDVDIADAGAGRQSRRGRPRPDHHHDGQHGRFVPDSRHHRARRFERRRISTRCPRIMVRKAAKWRALQPFRGLIVRLPSPSARRDSRAGLEPATPEKSMFIQTEATPNPATLKFIPGRTVLDSGTLEFANREAAARSPLAEKLFGVPGVTSVFYGSDFVTVTKDDSDWQHLKPAILGAIMEHYMSGAPLLADGSAASDEAADEEDEFFNEADAETVATIKDLIETRVRPAVANDGGDITFRGFKDGIVYLNMKGSCAGCPSSTATLQHGIQNLLKHFVPDVVEVRPM